MIEILPELELVCTDIAEKPLLPAQVTRRLHPNSRGGSPSICRCPRVL